MKLKEVYNKILSESILQKMLEDPNKKVPINDPYLPNTVRNRHKKIYIDDLLSTGWKTGGMYEERPEKDLYIKYGYGGHHPIFFYNDKLPEITLGFDNGGVRIWIKKEGKTYLQEEIHSFHVYNQIFGSVTGNIERKITAGWAKFASVGSEPNLKIEGK